MIDKNFTTVDDILTHMQSLNDDERYQFLIELYAEKQYNLVVKAISLLQSDEYKLKIAEKFYHDSFWYDLKDIALTMNEDKFKMTIIDLLLSENEKIDAVEIAQSFKSDEAKLMMIEKLVNLKYLIGVTNIAVTLSDDNKVKYAKKFLSDEQFLYAIQIANSITNDENKQFILEKFQEQRKWNLYFKVAQKLKTDEFKLKAIDVLIPNDKLLAFKLTTTLKEREGRETFFYNYFKYWDYMEIFLDSIKDAKEYSDYIRYVYTDQKIQKDYGNYFKEAVIRDLKVLERDDYENIYQNLNDILTDYMIDTYHLNRKNIMYIQEQFGYGLYKYVDSINLQNIIRAPLTDIVKITKLLKGQKLNNDDINNIYNSLLQQEFTVSNKDIRNTFTYFKDKIKQKQLKDLIPKINEICNIVSLDNLLNNEQFLSSLKTSGYQLTKEDDLKKFLNDLCLTISLDTDENTNDLLNILNNITNIYVRTCRENYVREGLANKSKNLLLHNLPDKEKQLRKIFSNVELEKIKSTLDKIDRDSLNITQIAFLNDKHLVDECIKFKKNPKNYLSEDISLKNLTSKYLGTFSSILTKAYEQKLLNELYYADDILGAEFEEDKINYYDILCNLNYEQMKSHILVNDEIENKLKQILDKYKIISWGNVFNPILTKLDYEVVGADLASLINYSDVITERVDAKTLTPIILLNEISLFSVKSSFYKTLFGSDNYKYLVSNPSPNASSMTRDERLNKATILYKQMFKRDNINVPPINKVVEVDGKKMRIVLGDVANPINLVLGERTGACSRIGGNGNTLFEYCLLSTNGFNIRFEDAITNDFVSKVSGFRNGNTVFLNELFYSLSPNFISSDLIKACSKVAQDLVEITKGENKPIDNVVITDSYAMEKAQNDLVDFNVDNIKAGLGLFYSDIDKSGIVLASSKDSKLVPIKLYLDMPKYNVLRQKPQRYLNDTAACKAVNKALLTEAILNNIEFVDVDYVEDATIAITGEDWYLYIDDNQEIHGSIFRGIDEQRYKNAQKEFTVAYQLMYPLVKNENIMEEEKTSGK